MVRIVLAASGKASSNPRRMNRILLDPPSHVSLDGVYAERTRKSSGTRPSWNSVRTPPIAGTRIDLRAGHVHFDLDGVVAGFRRRGVVAQQIKASQFDTDGRDAVFQLALLSKMNLGSPCGGGQTRKRVSRRFRVAVPVEYRNQRGEIDSRSEE